MSTDDMLPLSISQYLNAANWAYYQSATILPPDLTPLLNGDGAQVTSRIDADGFYGAAFVNAATNQIVVTYQGTNTDAADGTYSFPVLLQQLVADVGIYLGQGPQTISAFADAKDFIATVQSAAAADHLADDPIVVAGHSLGAAEAEYVSGTLGFTGETFGTPGLSDTAIPAGTASNLMDYVDYGDPVGNYSAQSPDPLGAFVYDDTIRHIGTTTLTPVDGQLRAFPLVAGSALLTSGTSWSQTLVGAAILVDALATWHPTTNYAADLGVTLVNTDPLTGVADQVSDPSLLLTVLAPLIKLAESSSIAVSGSPDGNGLGASVSGDINIAVFDGQAPALSLTAPAGYQAAILAGGASMSFSDSGTDGLNVFAGAGTDTIDGGGGHDTVYGSIGTLLAIGGAAGLDYYGGTGASTVAGGGGSSNLTGGSGQDVLFGSAIGDDTLAAATGSATLIGTSGDTMFGGSGSSVMFAAPAGTAELVANAGSSTIVGGAGADTIWAAGSATEVFAGTGNDLLALAAGATTAVGGAGSLDVVQGAGQASVFAGTGANEFDFFSNFSTGTTDVVGYVAGRDHVAFVGYGAGAVSMASSDGNLTVSLSGGGHVTFFGVTSFG